MSWCVDYEPMNLLALLIGGVGLLLVVGSLCVAVCFSKRVK